MNRSSAPDQINAYLDWYFDWHPVQADALGASGYANRLGDFSAASFESRQREAGQWLARFEAEPAAVDRDLIVSSLRGVTLMESWPAWRRDPAVYLGPVLAGLLLPFLHRLHPEAELVDGVLSRLAQVPKVLAGCRDNLDANLAAPRLVRRGLRQAAAGPSFLRISLRVAGQLEFKRQQRDRDRENTIAERLQSPLRKQSLRRAAHRGSMGGILTHAGACYH